MLFLSNEGSEEVKLCEELNYANNGDVIDVAVRMHVPKDVSMGEKELTIVYEAIVL